MGRDCSSAERTAQGHGTDPLTATALEEGDAAEIRRALNTVARSLGMTTVAEGAGLGRERLYKALDDIGNPEFATVLKLMKTMGLKLTALPIDKR